MRAFLVLATMGAQLAHAQAPAVPAWMQVCFAQGATTTSAPPDQHPVKHNTFIGSYTAQLTIRTPEGIRQQLYLSAWQDSTRGVMQLEMVRGLPHTTWFADIGANVGVVANVIGRKAVVSELKDVLLVDRLREPGKIREFAPPHLEPTGKREEIAGVPCVQYNLIEAQNTMDIWTADIAPSPFADGPAWMPMNNGPLKTFRLLFKFGDLVAFRFALEPLLELEVLEYRPGPAPPPVPDLERYTVVGTQALPR
ncbi:MAG: hypothetical protein JNM62_00620 [Flavobacteriales bacterium]|nr:hypothetical protein [Flavobacteriales bacterium]